MTIEENQVTGEEEVVADPNATDQTQDGVAQTTPAPTPSVDVEALRAEYEKKLAAAQNDINQVKSSLQSREAAKDKQYKIEQEALRKQLREVQMKGMDENQRKQYEASLATEELQNLQQRVQEAEQRAAETNAMLDAQKFFVSQGVPVTSLVFDQGYDALVNSGWGHLSAELQQLRNQAANPDANKKPVKPLKPAPEVLTDKAPASKGSNWADLRKRYGSEEAVYQLIEAGQLDASILPA